MTRTPLSRSNVKVTRPLYSPPCWRVRRLRQWASERVGLGETAATLPSAQPREVFRRQRGEEENGGCISWRHAHLQLVYINSVREANRLWGESSLGRIVCGVRRPWGEMSMGRNVLPWGEVSIGQNVRWAKSP